MTGRPVLGDFLISARRYLERAAAPASTSAPGRDAEEITASFHRVVTALAGYAADLTISFGELPERDLKALSAFARAALQARDALSSAAASLGSPEATGPPANAQARWPDAAATSLMAGRDLIQTHFESDRGGTRRGRSSWAPVITSPPVTRALLAEIATMSREAAGAGAETLPAARPWPAAELGRRLHLACQWLALAGASGQSAYQHEPVSEAEQNLLHAIPCSALPPRRVPDGTELVPELCAAVITTSERVSHLAWTSSGAAPGSPAVSVTSWRRIASAGTATSHHCHLLLTALAARTGQQHPSNASAIGDVLERTAAQARLSRAAWLSSGRELSQVTTDVRWQTSRTAAEAADLTLWTGKLAFASPSWVPSDGPHNPVRRPENLATTPADVPELVTALHYTAEALERLAVSSEEQIRGASRAHRVLMPAKTLPDGSETFDQFNPAPDDRIASLLAACRAATKASTHTVTAVADIAGDVRARSRVLTTARIAIRPCPRAVPSRPAETGLVAEQEQALPEPADASPGPTESRLRDLGVTSPRLLWRASGVDRLGRQVIADATASRRVPASAGRSGNPGAVMPGRSASAVRHAGMPHGKAHSAQQELEAEP